ncbi:glutathione S-transferase [Patellaria atrata CBS 101060]|uniref:Glutathione S-transferase n=1 Tax=Patellaria atrata CBS 101060 TaxID=1346257 RepID=A0A9P4S1Q1_9PEZI|nr:glutathione S-transferase [Patellaria atrata CBS 101060]
MAEPQPDITLYTTQTPNGVKISILLEELGLPYKVHKIDITKDVQKEPWFLAINPNGRIPALTDTFTDGKAINLFESGSIMQYLVSRYDPEHKVSFPAGSRESYEVNNWLFFQNAGLGPMQGQANHFNRYAPERIEYGVNRYVNETRRLYRVLDTHLKDGDKQYLVGNKCTIADIAHFGWINMAAWSGVEIDEFPTLKAWKERMLEREGVKKGKDVPEPTKMNLTKEEMEKKAAETRAWIQKGMKDTAQK